MEYVYLLGIVQLFKAWNHIGHDYSNILFHNNFYAVLLFGRATAKNSAL